MFSRIAKPGDAFSGLTNEAARQKLEIIRDFQTSRDRVWRAWTQPDVLLRWLGPRHYPAVEVRADVRVGGAWRACLKSDSDKDVLWQSGRYLIVAPPERLEFTFAWEGSNHEDGPGVLTHVVVRLEELADGGTRMYFSQTGLVSSGSAKGHSAGWNSTFERLAAFLRDAD
ncbi:MAG: SRPBCC domain-containing protein [Alphaproteobacteria bacterium]|nr:SRPBCC domain-containing protein [Alphaproteobacteria bacterium]